MSVQCHRCGSLRGVSHDPMLMSVTPLSVDDVFLKWRNGGWEVLNVFDVCDKCIHQDDTFGRFKKELV